MESLTCESVSSNSIISQGYAYLFIFLIFDERLNFISAKEEEYSMGDWEEDKNKIFLQEENSNVNNKS